MPTAQQAIRSGAKRGVVPTHSRPDKASHARYRAKDTNLEVYDDMAEARRTWKPYPTRLDLAPGAPADEQGNFFPLSGPDAFLLSFAACGWSAFLSPSRVGDNRLGRQLRLALASRPFPELCAWTLTDSVATIGG